MYYYFIYGEKLVVKFCVGCKIFDCGPKLEVDFFPLYVNGADGIRYEIKN